MFTFLMFFKYCEFCSFNSIKANKGERTISHCKIIIHYKETKLIHQKSSLARALDNKRKHNLWLSVPNALSIKINELAPTLKEKGIDIIHNYDNNRKGRQIKIINLQKISSLSSYRSSSGGDEEIRGDEQGISNFFPPYSVNEQINLESPEAVAGITPSMSNDTMDHDAIGDTKPNIHEIADRLYSGSDVWVCKNCNERGDRWHILNHLQYCKRNKKQ